MRRFGLLVLTIGFLIPFLASAPANAQATRTWVSGVGDDANPCSRTAPCKTFAGAISKTAAFGEINVLDPGGFGAVTITKSITIRSDHVEAGVLVSGTNGIVVSLPASTDRVLLEGLDIEGLGTGLNGVQIIGSGTTTIVNCAIRHFTGNGVNLAGTSSATGHHQGLDHHQQCRRLQYRRSRRRRRTPDFPSTPCTTTIRASQSRSLRRAIC